MREVTNLTVHGIGPTARELDPGEDETWVRVDQFEQVLDAIKGRDDVYLTFDDGNASDVEIALPRMLDRGITGEFFVLAGRLGEPGRLTQDQVVELHKAGMAIGSHGWAHQDWRKIDTAEAVQEMVRANELLAELVGYPVTRVAIPFGSYDRNVLRRLREAGITRAYTSDGGRARPEAWLQQRTSLRHDIDAEWTREVLDGVPTLPRRARGAAARLVKRTRG